MFKITILLEALLLVLLVNRGYSQVRVVSRPMRDSIMLRWAPSDIASWKLGNKYGYKVERITIIKKKKLVKDRDSRYLTDTALSPYDISEWEKHSSNKYVAVAAECIFGKNEDNVSNNPHAIYKKYKAEQQRYSFALFAADQSMAVARMSGLYFADHTAQVDENYLYRVCINAPDSLAVDTGYVYTGISMYQELPKPLQLRAKWKDKKVELRWNIKFLSHVYNSYLIEKSIGDSLNFCLQDSNVVVQVSKSNHNASYSYRSDTLQTNEEIYYYRIRGVNAFGQTGPPSTIVSGNGIKELKTAPVIIKNELIENRAVLLTWEYPKEYNRYINGFRLYRSESPNGRKKLVMNGDEPLQRFYRDTVPKINNYYSISVFNNVQEQVSPINTYVALIDSVPPSPPTGLWGEIDSLGVAKIIWNANKEEDISGYRVYKSNRPDVEFTLITPSVVVDTTYSTPVNLKTLTKKIYYKVTAIDARDNQSRLSDHAELKRPDIIPPLKPLFEEIREVKKRPELVWIPSSSSDVVSHIIYRMKVDDDKFNVLTTLQATSDTLMHFVDKTVEPGIKYIYRIAAKDDSGLLSDYSKRIAFKVPYKFEEKIKLRKRVFANEIKLQWNLKLYKTVDRVLIYRAVNDSAFKLYGNSNSDFFLDKDVQPAQRYKYTIKVIFNDGSSSAFSKPIKANI